ncbi:hypothetical protein Bca4012_064826 [Brassica carinata]
MAPHGTGSSDIDKAESKSHRMISTAVFVIQQRREGKERLCFIQSHTPNNLKLISERFTSSDSIPSTYNNGNRDWHRVSKGSSIAGDQFAIAKETRRKLGMGSNMCTMYPYHQLLYLDKKAIGGSLGNEVTPGATNREEVEEFQSKTKGNSVYIFVLRKP